MVSLNEAVLTGVYALLKSGLTLAPIYSVVPEGTQPPVAIIGELSPEYDGGKGEDPIARYEVRVTTVVGGTSRKALYALMGEVESSIVGQRPVFDGVEMSEPVLLSGDDRLNEEGTAIIGEQSFQIFAQLAD